MAYLKNVKNNEPLTNPVYELTHQTQQLHSVMSRILSDAYMLLAKAQNIHWNAKGLMFYSLHQLSEKTYKNQLELIDDIAERMGAIGAQITVSLRQFEDNSCLKGELTKLDTAHTVDQIVSDFALCAAEARRGVEIANSISDFATADLLTRVIADYDHTAWLFRSTLESH